MEPFELTASQAAERIAAGTLTSEALTRSCLERIAARDPKVKAWAHVNPEQAIAEARQRDRSDALGPLHGVPVGIKDMIDTADLPTEYNSPIYEGFRPARDAACVAVLRGSGAVILGKVTTVEFASHGRKPPTGNPRNLEHTPGGSSSGTGASVADHMVPMALGTQTGGSLIRPASFCGIFGMKPTFGLISIEGIKVYDQSLDTIGYVGRSAEDLARMSVTLGVTEQLPESRPIEGARIGVFRTQHWDDAEAATQQAIEDAAAQLSAAGAVVSDVGVPDVFKSLTEMQDRVMHWEGRGAYRAEYLLHYDDLAKGFRDEVENATGRTRRQMIEAYDHVAHARVVFESAFSEYDAWLTPSVPGEAPRGLAASGLATFNRMWTALHCPCITLPSHHGPNGLPVGVQLVAPRLSDEGLLGLAETAAKVLVRS